MLWFLVIDNYIVVIKEGSYVEFEDKVVCMVVVECLEMSKEECKVNIERGLSLLSSWFGLVGRIDEFWV